MWLERNTEESKTEKVALVWTCVKKQRVEY